MSKSQKKKTLILLLTVSVIAMAFCSSAWSQQSRLMSYTANTFQLNLTIKQSAVQNYLNAKINPALLNAGQVPLIATPTGLLMIYSRANLRGDDGNEIYPGTDAVIALFLYVWDPNLPSTSSPRYSTLVVEGFHSNDDSISYVVNRGLAHPQNPPSKFKISYELEQEGNMKIKGTAKVQDERGAINFTGKFVDSEPFVDPPIIPGDDFVSVSPNGLRYAYAPERIFEVSRSWSVYEAPMPISATSYKLEINLSDPDLGAIFNSLTESGLSTVRFMHQIVAIDEID